MEAYVTCPACGEEHKVKDVEFLNIEEDIYGRDVLGFSCPQNPEDHVTALVWVR